MTHLYFGSVILDVDFIFCIFFVFQDVSEHFIHEVEQWKSETCVCMCVLDRETERV